MLLQLCSHPGGLNGAAGTPQEEPILWLSPAMAAPSSVCPMGNLSGSCCPSKDHGVSSVPKSISLHENETTSRSRVILGEMQTAVGSLCWRQHLTPHQLDCREKGPCIIQGNSNLSTVDLF